MARTPASLVSITRRSARRTPEACAPNGAASARARTGRRSAQRTAAADLLPVMKALSDETRLGIVTLLIGAEHELCACDIEETFALTQPTISHHMRVLREAGLVTSERRGAWVYYAATSATRRLLDTCMSVLRQPRD